MEKVVFENPDLIPVDSLLYKLDLILAKHRLSKIRNRFNDKSPIKNIILGIPISRVRPLLLDIFHMIENNNHYITDYSNRNLSSHAGNGDSYMKEYRNDRILSPFYLNYYLSEFGDVNLKLKLI